MDFNVSCILGYGLMLRSGVGNLIQEWFCFIKRYFRAYWIQEELFHVFLISSIDWSELWTPGYFTST